MAYEYLKNDDFDRFLIERERNILEKIGEILGLGEIEKKQTLISPGTPFTNKILFHNTLKSCREHIYWIDKYFTQKGLELLSESRFIAESLFVLKWFFSIVLAVEMPII